MRYIKYDSPRIYYYEHGHKMKLTCPAIGKIDKPTKQLLGISVDHKDVIGYLLLKNGIMLRTYDLAIKRFVDDNGYESYLLNYKISIDIDNIV